MLIHTDFVSIAGYWLMLDWQDRFILRASVKTSSNSIPLYRLCLGSHLACPSVTLCRNAETTLVRWFQDTNPESRLLHRRLTAIVCSACIPVGSWQHRRRGEIGGFRV